MTKSPVGSVGIKGTNLPPPQIAVPRIPPAATITVTPSSNPPYFLLSRSSSSPCNVGEMDQGGGGGRGEERRGGSFGWGERKAAEKKAKTKLGPGNRREKERGGKFALWGGRGGRKQITNSGIA